VSIPTYHAIRFCWNNQVTAGAVRSTATKIFPLNAHGSWRASGELPLIHRVAERLACLPTPVQQLPGLRDTLTGFVKEAMTSLLAVHFRTQFFLKSPDDLLSLHPADFLFVDRALEDAARLLREREVEMLAGNPRP